jgi:hypothetical protein
VACVGDCFACVYTLSLRGGTWCLFLFGQFSPLFVDHDGTLCFACQKENDIEVRGLRLRLSSVGISSTVGVRAEYHPDGKSPTTLSCATHELSSDVGIDDPKVI